MLGSCRDLTSLDKSTSRLAAGRYLDKSPTLTKCDQPTCVSWRPITDVWYANRSCTKRRSLCPMERICEAVVDIHYYYIYDSSVHPPACASCTDALYAWLHPPAFRPQGRSQLATQLAINNSSSFSTDAIENWNLNLGSAQDFRVFFIFYVPFQLRSSSHHVDYHRVLCLFYRKHHIWRLGQVALWRPLPTFSKHVTAPKAQSIVASKVLKVSELLHVVFHFRFADFSFFFF